MRYILDLQFPYIPENIATHQEQTYNFWSDNLIKIIKYAKDNISKAKEIRKKMMIKVQKIIRTMLVTTYMKKIGNNDFQITDTIFRKIILTNGTTDYYFSFKKNPAKTIECG